MIFRTVQFLIFLTVFTVLWSAFSGFAQGEADSGSDAALPLYFTNQDAPVEEREGVARRLIAGRFHNNRVAYRLSYEALVGPMAGISDDKQIEAVRKPYGVTKTVDQFGYTSLGLDPGGNFNDVGFFNLYINDVGLTYCAPKADAGHTADCAWVKLVWQNSIAEVTQTFALQRGQTALLMRLHVRPRLGQTVDRLVLRLRNEPRMGNTAYGNPASRSNTVSTAVRQETPRQVLDLDVQSEFWVSYFNADLGHGPSGLLFLPDEVEKAQVLLGNDRIHTNLFLKLQKRRFGIFETDRQTFHFALWEIPKLPNEEFVAFLNQHAETLRGQLKDLAGRDWPDDLQSVRNPPLRLTDWIYRPSDTARDRGYVIAPSHPLSYVDANTLPKDELTALTMPAAPNQRGQAAFLAYGLENVGPLTMTWSDLTSERGATIAADNVDVRVVKVWPQRESLWGGSEAMWLDMTPELLVRNDLLDTTTLWTEDGPGASGLITGPVKTLLRRDMSKQFWVGIDVPPDTPAGDYAGHIRMRPADGKSAVLPLVVRVHPFQLHPVDDRYTLGIYYRGKPYPNPKGDQPVTAEYISRERYRRDLENMREHGINSISFFLSYDLQNLDIFYPPYVQAGMNAPVMMSHWGPAYSRDFSDDATAKHKTTIRNFLAYCAAEDYPAPAFYGIDEPEGEEVEVCRKRADITRSVTHDGDQGRYMVAGNGKALAPLVGHVDYPIVSSYYTSRKQMEVLKNDILAANGHPLYYWQIWGEYPKGSRLNAGYFLYASGYDGVFPYVYQHFGGDPYTDVGGPKRMLACYPSADGPVTTLQWEAFLAGVTDLRYLVTLENLLDQAESKHGAEAVAQDREILQKLLDKYGYQSSRYWGRMIYGALNWPEHQDSVPPEQFDRDRQVLTAMILKWND